MSNPKRKQGRPVKLTDEIQEKVCNAIRLGSYIETAVIYAGVPKSTFYDWLKTDKSFSDAIQRAMAESELRMLRRLDGSAEKGSIAAQCWIMERRFQNRWGRKERVQFTEHEEPTEEENLHEKIVASIAIRNKKKGIIE